MPKLNPSIFRMLLDVQDSVSKYEMHVKEGDTRTRVIEATLADGGCPFEIPTGANAVMYANNGTETTNYAVTIQTDGRLTLNIPAEMMASAGEYNCEFTLDATYSTDGYMLTTPSFKIIVDETV